MANIKSQIKRNRQNVARTARNKAVRSELKTRTKKVMQAAEAGDSAQAEEAFRITQKRIDQAAAKGVMHPNTAARKKSRLTKKLS